MALTWKNVDTPEGLSKAAALYQNSVQNALTGVKGVASDYVDMQSNEATAALEARLAKEQQLAQVDALTQMDNNQLRESTSNWIDPTKARELIKGRQTSLEQQQVGNFNEALAQGRYEEAGTTLAGLEGRQGFDASGLRTQLDKTVFDKLVTENPDEAINTAKTAEQKIQATNAAFNKALLGKKWDSAGLYATTPEQQQQLTMARNTDTINAKFPKFAARLNNATAEDATGIIKEVENELYSGKYDVQTIATLQGALAPLKADAVQKVMRANTVAAPAQQLVTDAIAKNPEVAGKLLAPEYRAIEEEARKSGIPVENIKLVTDLNNVPTLNEQVDFNSPNNMDALKKITDVLDQNDRWIWGDSFGPKEVIQRINDSKIDLTGVTYAGLAEALASVDFNALIPNDETENAKLAVAIQAQKATQEARASKAQELFSKQLLLDQKKADLASRLDEVIVNNSKVYTEAVVGNKGLPADAYKRLNPTIVGGELLGIQAKQDAAKLAQFEKDKVSPLQKELEATKAANARLESALKGRDALVDKVDGLRRTAAADNTDPKNAFSNAMRDRRPDTFGGSRDAAEIQEGNAKYKAEQEGKRKTQVADLSSQIKAIEEKYAAISAKGSGKSKSESEEGIRLLQEKLKLQAKLNRLQ